MRTSRNYRTNAQRYNNYPELDTDPNHYRNYTEGTMIHLASGYQVSLKNMPVDSVHESLTDSKDEYLDIDDGYSRKLIAKKDIEMIESHRFYDKSRNNWRRFNE